MLVFYFKNLEYVKILKVSFFLQGIQISFFDNFNELTSI